MRVIAGKYKGMRIPFPKSGSIRPTTDRAREALFNILDHQYNLADSLVIDLFAGSGAMALEFASRGAKSVLCVEKNRSTAKALKSFFNESKIAEIEVICQDAFRPIRGLTEAVSFVFADPPYDIINMANLPDHVFENINLKEDAILVVEHRSSFKWNHKLLFDQRKYGQSVFSFFAK